MIWTDGSASPEFVQNPANQTAAGAMVRVPSRVIRVTVGPALEDLTEPVNSTGIDASGKPALIHHINKAEIPAGVIIVTPESARGNNPNSLRAKIIAGFPFPDGIISDLFTALNAE